MASPTKRALLLLPPAPSTPTYASLKVAYHAPLFLTLKELAQSAFATQHSVLLEIALPIPALYHQRDAPKAALYETTQQFVANLYKLICITASKNAIGTEDGEGVDARIILVAYPRDGKLTAAPSNSTPEQELQGPVIDIATLARAPRPWDVTYSVETEEGERLLQKFLSFSSAQRPVSRIRGGIVQTGKDEGGNTSSHVSSSTQHFAVAVGGTFDHLHIGHKLLLTMFAFVLDSRNEASLNEAPSSLTVGITGDALLQNKKYAEHLESWKRRQESVHNFLTSILYFGQAEDSRVHTREINEPGPNGHAVHVTFPSGLVIKYVEIWDPFGPTITDKDITALVLSLETRGGGAAVNSKRGEQGWDPLEVFEVAVLDASEEDTIDETFQSKLSSTEIRRRRTERMQPRAKA